jgi:hypothetical protein
MRSGLMREAERLDREAEELRRLERDALEDPARCEVVEAPTGQRLPRWVVSAMRGPPA